MSIESTELGHTLAAKPVIGRGAPQSSCELVHQIPGLIEIKGYVSDDGERVSIARFGSEEALRQWRFQPEHVETQRGARERYDDSYWVQVCRTVTHYTFSREAGYVHNPT
jgi:heme-degrading monooxygenase HmoA